MMTLRIPLQKLLICSILLVLCVWQVLVYSLKVTHKHVAGAYSSEVTAQDETRHHAGDITQACTRPKSKVLNACA
jgi:hypothetical protein